MKKWQLIVPAGLIGMGLAAYLFRRVPAKAAPKAGGQAPAPAKAPTNAKTGSYSFISGFRDAAKVEVLLDYDADKFSFAVVEEGFLSDTGDSHVALLEGEDFSFQMEYASYHAGEGFEAHLSHLAEKHPDLSTVRYGSVDGVCYLEGDAVCFCFQHECHTVIVILSYFCYSNLLLYVINKC